MKKITCPICGYEHPQEIISHINQDHEGGLERFFLFFHLPVVSDELMDEAWSTVHSGEATEKWLFDYDTALLLIQESEAQKPERSKITVVHDFNNEYNF